MFGGQSIIMPESKQPKEATKAQEEGYLRFYFNDDVKSSRIALIFFALPFCGYIFNDFQFFGFSQMFYSLLGLRLVLLAIIALIIHYLGKIQSFRSYNILVYSAAIILLIGGAIVNTLRPPNFWGQAIITIISVFVLYIAIPFRFLYQTIFATITTVGEALIVLFIVKPQDETILFTILFALFITNLIAAVSAWHIHSYRKRIYREYVKRKKAQETLEEQNKHLEELVEERTQKLKTAERFAAIGATAGMVGHDLRNPLTGISNAAYFLNKKYSSKLDPTGQEMLRLITSNVEYSNKIINDLLDYSGNVILEAKQKTNPKNLLDHIVSLILIPENIEVINQLEDRPEFKVDLPKITRVFLNLIKNSIDAMPEGGKIILKSEQREDFVKIILTDTGPGISEEYQKNLFQPLFTTKAKGMGFGLAICQRIIEAHQGEISVKSIVGVGTTFIIELPRVHTNS
jgi:signal transduction histidine kinase